MPLSIPFSPDEFLEIDAVTYRVAADPAASHQPLRREGQQSSVIQLRAPDNQLCALKLFTPAARRPALVAQARQLAPYATIPGLAAATRTTLTPTRHPDLLRRFPDLSYALLMPWVDGPSWQQLVQSRTPLSPAQSLLLARSLALLLTSMEEQGLAHGDLSAGNLLLPALVTPSTTSAVALVDLEQCYGPGLERPDPLPIPDRGYAHRTSSGGYWGPDADRFAGAMLLAELLCWCEPSFRTSGIIAVSPGELPQSGARDEQLSRQLRARWGEEIAHLFGRAWQSRSLSDCPSLGEWLIALPEQPPTPEELPAPSPVVAEPPSSHPSVAPLLALAEKLRAQGNYDGALAAYQQLLTLLPPNDPQAVQVRQQIQALTQAQAQVSPPTPMVRQDPIQGRVGATPPPPPPAPGLTPQRRQLIGGVGLLILLLLAGWAVLQTLGNSSPSITPETASRVQLAQRLSAGTSVYSVAFTPDGKTLATGSEDGTVRLWQVEDGSLINSLDGESGLIVGVTFSPDGKTLATGSGDGAVQLWQVEDGSLIDTLVEGGSGWVFVAFTPDGRTLATASVDGAVQLWRVDDGSLIRVLEESNQGFFGIAFAPDGRTLAGGANDGTIGLWRVADGSLIDTLAGGSGTIFGVTFSPDGRTLATGSQDGAVRLWRVEDGSLIDTLDGGDGLIIDIAFAPDGKTLAVGSGDGTIRLWQVEDGSLINTLAGGAGWVSSVAFSPDGKTLAAGSQDGAIGLWQVDAEKAASSTVRRALPEEVGVFLSTESGWTKLRPYEWDPMFGGYVDTETLTPSSLPVARPKATILINQVPVDPSALFWGVNVVTEWRWKSDYEQDLGGLPATTRFVEQGVYEVTTEELSNGLYALVVRGSGSFSFRAYFFRIAPAAQAMATSVPAQPAPAGDWVPALVAVPAGPFLMGSSRADDTLAYDDEQPQHTLTLPDYWIGQTEVTNAQFRPFVEGDGYTNRDYWTTDGWAWKEALRRTQPSYWDDAQWNGNEQPVVGVSWFEAVAYVRWLSAQTGHPFRLPTEAEWEKAARGSDGRIWPWGNAWAAGRANTEEAGQNRTTPVGQYPEGASPYGALDMAGNVREWCATVWPKPYPYTVEEEWTTVYLERDEFYRVLRGGSWDYEQRFARGAYHRYDVARAVIYNDVGMRVASSAPYP